MFGTIGLAELLGLAALAAGCVATLVHRRALRLHPATSELPGSGLAIADRYDLAMEPFADLSDPWWCLLDWLNGGGTSRPPRWHASPIVDAAEAPAAGHGGSALNAQASRAAGKMEAAGPGRRRPTAGQPLGRTDGNSIVSHVGGPAP